MLNVRSLVDNEGTVEIARLSSVKSGSEDQRIDLVIRELNRYGIKFAALLETKWFGNHVYHVEKCNADCWSGNTSRMSA